MLLGDLVLKFSSFLTGLTAMNGPTTANQSPLGTDAVSEFSPATSILMRSDVFTVQTSASIFFSYARETQIGELLKANNVRLTVFAPTNKAVMALSRKPHQGPVPVDDTVISEEEFDARSRENAMRWVGGHVVSQAIPSLSPSSRYETLLQGVTITVSPKSDPTEPGKPDWQRVVLNDNITIVDRAEAGNGILYLLDCALCG